MKYLAKAVLQSAAFLELSSDGDLDPDCAVGALEDLAHTISQMSAAEHAALRDATREALRAELAAPGPRAAALRFYDHFLLNFCTDLDQPELEGSEARDYWKRRLDAAPLPEGVNALDPGRATSLERELARELDTSHPLHGRTLLAIAAGPHPDDILVAPLSLVGPLHAVHLTWRTDTTPRWPHIREFRSLEQFLAHSDSETDA